MKTLNTFLFLFLIFNNFFLITPLSISDTPIGFAKVTKPSHKVEISTKSDLVTYAKKGDYIIYIKTMIDLSEGMLPTSAGGSNSLLDNFVKQNTGYNDYASLRDAYAKSCTKESDDGKDTTNEIAQKIWTCNAAYQKIVKLNIASNTWLIGSTKNSGIKGGTINISSVQNVVLRNLIIQDGYDPFPHHEKNDGYNAQLDAVLIQGTSNNIWVDHCTLEDTVHVINVNTGGSVSEKWQTFDGLLDMKKNIYDITISYNVFQNHDKTMLIGSSDSDGSNETRTITLHHNYFYNCGQRLPMVRNSKIHIFNNIYEINNSYYGSNYCVGVRKNALIIAENNYFGSGVGYSFKDSYGVLYSNGNVDNSKKKSNSSTSSSKPFTVSYSYNLESVDNALTNVKSDAGAGKAFSQ